MRRTRHVTTESRVTVFRPPDDIRVVHGIWPEFFAAYVILSTIVSLEGDVCEQKKISLR